MTDREPDRSPTRQMAVSTADATGSAVPSH